MENKSITSPQLLLDEEKCRNNIRRIDAKAQASDLDHRPHFKTHLSHEIGRWFRQEGIKRIAVSSVKMALYFAEDGWSDICVAFPTNIREIDSINELAKSINLYLLVENERHVQLLEDLLIANINVYIKMDIGYGRTGINHQSIDQTESLIFIIRRSKHLNFRGFLIHSGDSYKCRSKMEIEQFHREKLSVIKRFKNRLKLSSLEWYLSYGDTPSISIAQNFEYINELRAGNFVFYDLMQLQIGSCTFDQIAVCMACPVVAIHEDRNEIVIHGGAVHFSKEYLILESGLKTFGQVARLKNGKWNTLEESCHLIRISQEHGIVSATDQFIGGIRIGDLIYIIPVHSCLTANLMGSYMDLEGTIIEQ